jgi:hypothetical protein
MDDAKNAYARLTCVLGKNASYEMHSLPYYVRLIVLSYGWALRATSSKNTHARREYVSDKNAYDETHTLSDCACFTVEVILCVTQPIHPEIIPVQLHAYGPDCNVQYRSRSVCSYTSNRTGEPVLYLSC